jgi:hypothetical protein
MRQLRVVLAAAAIGLAACGGGAGPTTSEGSTTTAASTTGAPVEDPADLGDRIGDLYLAAYDDVVALLSARPEAAAAAADLAALKEGYVQQLVALGYEREALDASGRTTVDAAITAALSSLPATTYEAYQEAYAYYSGHPELANLIASFNVLGQYANFDLLREQSPDEAARLGVG